MTDEISDYFAGSSPRKVEPLDESEMFDDLLTPQPEQTIAEEAAVEPPSEPVFVAESNLAVETRDDVNREASETKDQENVSAETGIAGDDPAPASHWDDLASSLGLEPAPARPEVPQAGAVSPSVTSERTAKIQPTVEPAGAAELERTKKSETKAIDESSADDVFSVKTEHKDAETTEEGLLADMFVPRESIDFDSPTEDSDEDPVEEEEDDLFAAFSGAEKTEPEPQIVEEESTNEELPAADVDENFVEFEVKDLRGHRDEDRESEGKRRRRVDRKERGNRQRKSKESFDEAAGESVVADQIEGTGAAETRKDRDDTRARKPRPEKRPRVETERNVRSDKKSETGRDVDSGKRKPKIPTWDDAISAVVEKNIKRHKSNTGRGGRRRRN